MNITACVGRVSALSVLLTGLSAAMGQCDPSAPIKVPAPTPALTASSQFGSAVDTLDGRVLAGAFGFSEAGSLAGAAHVYRRQGAQFVFEQRLPAIGLAANDLFGISLTFGGSGAFVGAPGRAGGRGAIFPFSRNGNFWFQPSVEIVAADATTNSDFGRSVAFWDGWLFGSARGAVYVFRLDNGVWTQRQKLILPVASTFSPDIKADNGHLLTGDRFATGTPNTGTVHHFALTNGTWTYVGEVRPTNDPDADEWGSKIDIDGDRAIIGARGDDQLANNAGSAYVFRLVNGLWVQEAKLLPPEAEASAIHGADVAIDQDIALVSATGDDGAATDTGAVRVYERIAGTWTYRSTLVSADGAQADQFGRIALQDGLVVVGATGDDDFGQSAGVVSVAFVSPAFAIVQQPTDVVVIEGQPAALVLQARGTPRLAYQWRKGGVAVVDGPTPGGGMISGARTNALVFSQADPSLAGMYDCVVTEQCGLVLTSGPAALTVAPAGGPCPGDANGDSLVSFPDITEVLRRFGTACP